MWRWNLKEEEHHPNGWRRVRISVSVGFSPPRHREEDKNPRDILEGTGLEKVRVKKPMGEWETS